MLLKSLKISGFKSFGRTTVLDFPRSISAIVGPNGSGKSNVAEAIAWVLGEQSIKSLRGKKGEDLIFNGSTGSLDKTRDKSRQAGMPQAGRAMVTLAFTDKESGDELMLSRAVYRDGQNEYFINDTPKRLKDIADFLDKLGTGTLRHHIISQGEVDRILNASSLSRREMIEDALGLRILQLKKQDVLRKLEKADENIVQVQTLQMEIQPHLRFLKKQADKAAEGKFLKEELLKLCRAYFSGTSVVFENESRSLAGQKEKPAKNYLEIKNKISELKDKLSKLKNEEKIPKHKDIKEFLVFIKDGLNEALDEKDFPKAKEILKKIKDSLSDFLKNESVTIFGGASLLKNEKAFEVEREIFNLEIKAREVKSLIQSAEAKEENLKIRQENFINELKEFETILGMDLKIAESDTENFDADLFVKLKKEIDKLRLKLEESGAVDEESLKECEEVKKRDEFLSAEVNDLLKSSASLNTLLKYIDIEVSQNFKNGILKINGEFQKFFGLMFGGGKAVLVENETGLDISVSLPIKKVKSLEMLSGGERALTSIALLFAMSQVKPPPFLILDETDAALDESNSKKYAEMLKTLSKQTQLILITHNRQTMSAADALYGVTMAGDGVSRLLSLKFDEAEEYVRSEMA